MSTRNWKLQPQTVARAGIFVALSTVALTASFLGVVALLTGRIGGLTARLPFYVLVMAICFVVVIVVFESVLRVPQQVLFLAVAVSILALVLVTLGGEGLVYLLRNTEQVVASQLLFYILAAGLIGTGFCYWAVRHWAELVDTASRL